MPVFLMSDCPWATSNPQNVAMDNKSKILVLANISEIYVICNRYYRYKRTIRCLYLQTSTKQYLFNGSFFSTETRSSVTLNSSTMGNHFRSLKTSKLYTPLFHVIYTSLEPKYKTCFLWLDGFGKNKNLSSISNFVFANLFHHCDD